MQESALFLYIYSEEILRINRKKKIVCHTIRFISVLFDRGNDPYSYKKEQDNFIKRYIKQKT